MKTIAVAIVPLMLASSISLASAKEEEPPPPTTQGPPAVQPVVPPAQQQQQPTQADVTPVPVPPPTTATQVAPPSPPPSSPPVIIEPARVQPQNDGTQLAATGMLGPRERLTTWDLNLDGAYGRMFGDSPEWTGFGRIRVGVLHVHNEMYFMLGGTYELSDRIAATFGIQGEVMHLASGFWAQVGALVDIRPRPGFMGAVGWSVFGVEVQQRNDEHFGSVVSLYGKIRIPVRIIAKAFEK